MKNAAKSSNFSANFGGQPFFYSIFSEIGDCMSWFGSIFMKFHILIDRFALKMQFIYDQSDSKGENVENTEIACIISLVLFMIFVWVIIWTNLDVQNAISLRNLMIVYTSYSSYISCFNICLQLDGIRNLHHTSYQLLVVAGIEQAIISKILGFWARFCLISNDFASRVTINVI